MKHAAVAVWALLVLGSASTLRAQESRPTIVFDGLVKDFGRVVEGDTIKHTFKFTNKGNAPLEILNVDKP